MGGNCFELRSRSAREGVLEKEVELIERPKTIDKAEDRQQFDQVMNSLGSKRRSASRIP